MDRVSWVVVFLAAGPKGLDPERLQKGLFLLSEQGVIPPEERYRFEPYPEGPEAFELLRDLDALIDAGAVAARAGRGRAREFEATAAGRDQASVLMERIDEKAVARVRDVREYVAAVPLRRLVEAVVHEYPEFGTRVRSA